MNDVLSGFKGWFLWNGRSAGQDWPAALRHLVWNSEARAIAIKTYDGPETYSQPYTIPDIKEALWDVGPAVVGAWGYHYGRDVPAELEQVRHALRVLQADFVILNVEDPAVETNPDTPAEWEAGLEKIRTDWPNASLYFCSHARPSYHPSQPYWQATKYRLVQQPMIYHTAMHMGPAESVETAIADFDSYALLTDPETGNQLPWSAAGAAYDVPGVALRPDDVVLWGASALEHGATSLIWWDADSVFDRPDIIEAVRRTPVPCTKEKTA